MTESNYITDHYVDWINSELRPNVYVVATLKQAMNCHDGAASYWVKGTKDRYSQVYDQFIRRLSRKIYGTAHWQKYRNLLPNAVTIEGGGYEGYPKSPTIKGKRPYAIQSGRAGVRYHLNICLRRPDWITFDDFEKAVRTVWNTIDWALPDIFIEKRTGESVGYSLKEGPEALIANSMSF